MGGVCSSCCGQRRKNNYEPLLLENEREAVADLLQYLESEYPLCQMPVSQTHSRAQTAALQTSSLARLLRLSQPFHSPTMSTCSAPRLWHSLRSPRRRSARLAVTPSIPSFTS